MTKTFSSMRSFKSKQWKGYFSDYFQRAVQNGISPLELIDQEWAVGAETAKHVYRYVDNHSTVLEIACGIGRVSRYIAPRCRQLYCTDIILQALDACRENLSHHSNVIYRQTNGYDLTVFPDACFDCVYSFTAFFHFDFELVVNYFAEITRVLKPRGIAIVEFKPWASKHDVRNLLAKIQSQGGIQEYEKDLDKWRYVSRGMLEVLCDYHNLEVIDADVTKFTFKKRADSTPLDNRPGFDGALK